jgi:protein tyrosine phosphatase (PTP) superfamily phosphohydrolase (DUF442 family)
MRLLGPPLAALTGLGSIAGVLVLSACGSGEGPLPAASAEPIVASVPAGPVTPAAPASSTSGTPTSGSPTSGNPISGSPSTAAGHDSPGGQGHEAPLHNYRRLSENVISGASPETDADLAYLAAQGVKTAISVDGARPDVEGAAKHGIRYVHIPIGYDGISREKQVWLAKAFAELDGPFYVHCHHGKHRGPAACTIGRITLDGVDADQAVADMKDRGTDPKYRGLYAVPKTFVKPTAKELAAAPKEFPSAAEVEGMQAAMVEIDAGWERMKAVRKAGWKVPAHHPDVDPAHEATILAQRFRELARNDPEAKADEGFRKMLQASEEAAGDLAAALKPGALSPEKAAVAFEAAASSCAKCHTLHRDNE